MIICRILFWIALAVLIIAPGFTFAQLPPNRGEASGSASVLNRQNEPPTHQVVATDANGREDSLVKKSGSDNEMFRDSEAALRPWGYIGLLVFLVGAIIYVLVYCFYKPSFANLAWHQKLVALVSHVPDVRCKPAYPVIAGVLCSLGFCLVAGYGLARIRFVVTRYDAHGTALTSAGLVFGVLISIISFWTLWQTKRIEQLYGQNIDGFKGLTAEIATEIRKLNHNFFTHGSRASVHHRVLLVTIHPCFGFLSFPDTEEERNFSSALTEAARNVRATKDAANRFQLRILCGTEKEISEFTKDFYKRTGGGNGIEALESRSSESSAKTETFLGQLTTFAGEEIIKRRHGIPAIQFAIVGNAVFEFILTKGEAGTGIAGARRIQESIVCSRFVEQFNLIERMLDLLDKKRADEAVTESIPSTPAGPIVADMDDLPSSPSGS